MSSAVENKFNRWAKPPSKTERERCENAIRAIRKAIAGSDKLRNRQLKVFLQGSYRNRVNVRQDSDVDIGVLCFDTFFRHYPPGTSHETFGNRPADYHYGQFKHDIHEALVTHFGSNAVHQGNKAVDIGENTYRVEADVAPFFEYRHYWMNESSWSYRGGVALEPDSGDIIQNYPERLLDEWPATTLHYGNGVAKNKATRFRYKGIVRILKKLRNEMGEAGIVAAAPIPGFLVECLVWNAADTCFDRSTWNERLREVLLYSWTETADEVGCSHWTEVNGIKFLFAPTQPWTRPQVRDFISATWKYVGLGS